MAGVLKGRALETQGGYQEAGRRQTDAFHSPGRSKMVGKPPGAGERPRKSAWSLPRKQPCGRLDVVRSGASRTVGWQAPLCGAVGGHPIPRVHLMNSQGRKAPSKGPPSPHTECTERKGWACQLSLESQTVEREPWERRQDGQTLERGLAVLVCERGKPPVRPSGQQEFLRAALGRESAVHSPRVPEV